MLGDIGTVHIMIVESVSSFLLGGVLIPVSVLSYFERPHLHRIHGNFLLVQMINRHIRRVVVMVVIFTDVELLVGEQLGFRDLTLANKSFNSIEFSHRWRLLVGSHLLDRLHQHLL